MSRSGLQLILLLNTLAVAKPATEPCFGLAKEEVVAAGIVSGVSESELIMVTFPVCKPTSEVVWLLLT